ncbi:MAG: class I SAM-dependent methyltransferase [Candidatus Aminicenantes bacterium]|nr:class I SAM-dependent methyltransferase [Candidatus Aminicenantes bacterium]
MAPDRVPFGFREVSPEEKRSLVRAQFDPIAATYDLADAVLSAGLDARWRKKGIRLLNLGAGERVLDLCGGTGDFALLAAERTGDRGQVIIYDFNRRMMEAGRPKIRKSPRGRIIRCVQGDAESISFSDERFDAVTLGFGLRNFVHTELGLREIHRVLKPAGKAVILEFSLPARRFLKVLYHFYSFRVMPIVARVICGTDGPFRYLAESIRVFPPPQKVAELIREAGFRDVRFRSLSQGLATLYTARKNGVWSQEVKSVQDR